MESWLNLYASSTFRSFNSSWVSRASISPSQAGTSFDAKAMLEDLSKSPKGDKESSPFLHYSSRGLEEGVDAPHECGGSPIESWLSSASHFVPCT
ncbi:hypothetical protein HOP50_03g25350 [Chloropicon primus]|uniref:Uncharacterized protein n=1 Tax=Chloropicon primus TaxID=1764295 RepID=A0A5B8MHV3_9CHLO|nr:hypothetical protein A3770_03p25350 [Chloropicon primus]UPQ99228.1 hypothetical protein HOP50_03g25350 [Chloropicon primus]|eukprot:QDZ20017.1 hypothetical protein A3770_03p25350 [Chloropicon primus]